MLGEIREYRTLIEALGDGQKASSVHVVLLRVLVKFWQVSLFLLTCALQASTSMVVRRSEKVIAWPSTSAAIASSATMRRVHASIITTLGRVSRVLLRRVLNVRNESFLLELLVRLTELVAIPLERLAAFFELSKRATELADLVRSILERIFQLANLVASASLHPTQLLILHIQLLLQALVGMLLVVDLLRTLIRPESHPAVRTFHDYGRTEATEDAHFVVLCRSQDRHGHIERLVEESTACRTGSGCSLAGAES